MTTSNQDKVIIVEGKSDREKISKLIKEPVDIICTNGTLGVSKLDELIDAVYDKEVYILMDADDAGDKLRRQFKNGLPNAEHLYIDRMFREVAAAPFSHLVNVFLHANIEISAEFL